LKHHTALPLLKMALSALERPLPNIELARGILRDLAGSDDAEPARPSELRAVSIAEAARRLSYSAKHLRELIKRGALGDAVIGSGRGTRVIVEVAVQRLADRGTSPRRTDEVEAAGERWAARNGMRVLSGGGAS
jgi:hypothetical protein